MKNKKTKVETALESQAQAEGPQPPSVEEGLRAENEALKARVAQLQGVLVQVAKVLVNLASSINQVLG